MIKRSDLAPASLPSPLSDELELHATTVTSATEKVHPPSQKSLRIALWYTHVAWRAPA